MDSSFYNKIKSGYRMSKPEHAPHDVYVIIRMMTTLLLCMAQSFPNILSHDECVGLTQHSLFVDCDIQRLT